MIPAPDHVAEMALIEMSRLQRYAWVFAIDDDAANQIAADCQDEIARREAAAPAMEIAA